MFYLRYLNACDVFFNPQVIPGNEGQSVEAVVWQDQRLFTAGLDGNLNEIDLTKLQIKVMIDF